MKKRALVWIRRDLRLSDHRAFFEACAYADEVQLVFVIDEDILRDLAKDNRQVTFIQNSLDEMDEALRSKGSRLLVIQGKPLELIPALAKKHNFDAVFWNKDYEPFAKKRDAEMKERLIKLGVEPFSFKDQVIFEEREIVNGSGEPYRVFTPYSKNFIKRLEAKTSELLRDYSPDFKKLMPEKSFAQKNAKFSDLGFTGVELSVPPGAKAAKKELKKFADRISEYAEARNFPAMSGTSRLSAHLRFGTVSIRETFRFCLAHLSPGTRVWMGELIWREFYQMILDQYPHVVGHAFREKYDQLPWSYDKRSFAAWCEGRTGFPLVDAAMRQLNQTGWMHNRLRMIVAMFLTKDLLIDWQWGEAYFAEQLVDLEVGSNNGGWQWSASTGCDAQPYFRVMNPVSQSERFDKTGEFIRQYVPELKAFDAKNIHWPHGDKKLKVKDYGYPEPMVDHAEQRPKAIAMFKNAK